MFFGISCRRVCPELTCTAAGEPGHHTQGPRAELCLEQGRWPRLAEHPKHSAVCFHEPHRWGGRLRLHHAEPKATGNMRLGGTSPAGSGQTEAERAEVGQRDQEGGLAGGGRAAAAGAAAAGAAAVGPVPDYESQRARQGRGRAAQPPRRAPTCSRRRRARGAEGRAGGAGLGRERRAGGGGQARPRGGVRRRPGRAGRGAASPGGLRGAPRGSAHCGAGGAGARRVWRVWRSIPGAGRGCGAAPIRAQPRPGIAAGAVRGAAGSAGRPRHARARRRTQPGRLRRLRSFDSRVRARLLRRARILPVTRARTEIRRGSSMKYVKKVFVSMIMSCPSLEISCLLYVTDTAGAAEGGCAPPPGSGSEQTNQWQVQE